MDSAISKNRSFSRRNSLRRYAPPVFLTIVLGFIFHQLNLLLAQSGFISNISLYLGEKSLLMHRGNPPRLENIGFDNPPLPHAIVTLGNDPLLMTAFVGAAGLVFLLIRMYWNYRRGTIPFSFFAVLFLYITLSPLMLFVLTQQLPTTVLLIILLLMYAHLYRYAATGVSYDLFLFGILSCALIFTEFQASLLIPLLTFGLTAKVIGSQPVRGLAIMATAMFPTLATALSWCYLNWLFMGDPLHFLHYWRSALQPVTSLPGNALSFWAVENALIQGLTMLGHQWLLILPWLVLGIWLLLTIHRTRSCVTSTIFLSPFIFLIIQLTSRLTTQGNSFSLLFVLAAISIRVHLHRFINQTFFSPLFTASLAVSLLASHWLPLHGDATEEKLFMQIIHGQKITGNLQPYMEILDATKDQGIILADDTTLYPLVFLSGNPSRFILPYNYEFDPALATPQAHARYIVLTPQPNKDKVAGRFPKALQGYLPHYTQAGRFGQLLLYENRQKEPHRPLAASQLSEAEGTHN